MNTKASLLWVAGSVTGLLVLSAGCEEADAVCEAGVVQTCPCLGGGVGVQTCESDGNGWGGCQCGTGGTGGSTSTTSTSSSSSSSGCDEGWCPTCVGSDCTASVCAAEFTACDTNVECLALRECVKSSNCPPLDEACIQQCVDDHPSGVADLCARINCVECVACSVDCAGETEGTFPWYHCPDC